MCLGKTKTTTPRHIIVKLFKTSDKMKILEVARAKLSMTSNFLLKNASKKPLEQHLPPPTLAFEPRPYTC
jgi:hypothetical protein